MNLEKPMKKQKSWADYNAAIRHAYTKEDDEDPLKTTLESCELYVHLYMYVYVATYVHTSNLNVK